MRFLLGPPYKCHIMSWICAVCRLILSISGLPSAPRKSSCLAPFLIDIQEDSSHYFAPRSTLVAAHVRQVSPQRRRDRRGRGGLPDQVHRDRSRPSRGSPPAGGLPYLPTLADPSEYMANSENSETDSFERRVVSWMKTSKGCTLSRTEA